MDLRNQLDECREKIRILTQREAYLSMELRRVADVYIYCEAPPRDQVFICYSHCDVKWMIRLKTVLAPIITNNAVNVWDDSMIRPGERWREQIHAALRRAKVAVLLVSPEFLDSEFIRTVELPSLLNKSGAGVVWFPVRASMVDRTRIIEYQAASDPERPLNGMAPAGQGRALVSIANAIEAAYRA